MYEIRDRMNEMILNSLFWSTAKIRHHSESNAKKTETLAYAGNIKSIETKR